MRVLMSPPFSPCDGNPYLYLLATGLRGVGAEVDSVSRRNLLRGQYDILHLHWPENALLMPGAGAVRAIVAMLSRMAVARSRGLRIVWTAHNVRPHEATSPILTELFWRGFERLVDGVVVLSPAGREALMRERPTLGKKVIAVTPHGHYRDVYENTMSSRTAAERLGIRRDVPTALFFGRIRRYKNVPQLVATFRELASHRPVQLVVAGACDDDRLRDEIEAATGGDRRVRLFLSQIQDRDVQIFMNSADLLVLPFRDILNSGSAILGLSFDRPVLAPAKGALRDLQAQVGKEWVWLYSGELDAKVLEAALNRAAADRSRRGKCPLDALEWDSVGAATHEAYLRLLHR